MRWRKKTGRDKRTFIGRSHAETIQMKTTGRLSQGRNRGNRGNGMQKEMERGGRKIEEKKYRMRVMVRTTYIKDRHNI